MPAGLAISPDFLRQLCLDAVIFRTAIVYGDPRSFPNFIPKKSSASTSGSELGE
jgi:hypothetical protein